MEKRELCISKVFLFTFPTLVALHQNDADRDLGLLGVPSHWVGG